MAGGYVAADTEGDGKVYARAMLLGEADGGKFEVMREDGRGAVVERSALRAARGEGLTPQDEKELAEGQQVYAVFGSWTLGFVNDLADADAAGRVPAVLTAGGSSSPPWLPIFLFYFYRNLVLLRFYSHVIH